MHLVICDFKCQNVIYSSSENMNAVKKYYIEVLNYVVKRVRYCECNVIVNFYNNEVLVVVGSYFIKLPFFVGF